MNDLKQLIEKAYQEDIPTLDVSTEYLFTDELGTAHLLCKADGVLSGIAVFAACLHHVDASIDFHPLKQDGELILRGDTLGIAKGKIKSLLQAERVALNFIQRMSGIASLTHQFVNATSGTSTHIYDTRKTTPGLRMLEKQAVRDGGGRNHRLNLSEMVMLKDNHLKASPTIASAVNTVKAKIPETMKIEVEVDSIAKFQEALLTACDIIMLDNMNLADMATCVALNQHRKVLEASGNMSLKRVPSVAKTGVDMISVGMLTHSYSSLDISFKIR